MQQYMTVRQIATAAGTTPGNVKSVILARDFEQHAEKAANVSLYPLEVAEYLIELIQFKKECMTRNQLAERMGLTETQFRWALLKKRIPEPDVLYSIQSLYSPKLAEEILAAQQREEI